MCFIVLHTVNLILTRLNFTAFHIKIHHCQNKALVPDALRLSGPAAWWDDRLCDSLSAQALTRFLFHR